MTSMFSPQGYEDVEEDLAKVEKSSSQLEAPPPSTSPCSPLKTPVTMAGVAEWTPPSSPLTTEVAAHLREIDEKIAEKEESTMDAIEREIANNYALSKSDNLNDVVEVCETESGGASSSMETTEDGKDGEEESEGEDEEEMSYSFIAGEEASKALNEGKDDEMSDELQEVVAEEVKGEVQAAPESQEENGTEEEKEVDESRPENVEEEASNALAEASSAYERQETVESSQKLKEEAAADQPEDDVGAQEEEKVDESRPEKVVGQILKEQIDRVVGESSDASVDDDIVEKSGEEQESDRKDNQ